MLSSINIASILILVSTRDVANTGGGGVRAPGVGPVGWGGGDFPGGEDVGRWSLQGRGPRAGGKLLVLKRRAPPGGGGGGGVGGGAGGGVFVGVGATEQAGGV